ncbi:MAG: hypothetical protein DRJ60_01075 [Thermoprotei archaeon]|nr:MAG: hypothetical protein DRJ60_01075 [Thermoprotei archaeon]
MRKGKVIGHRGAPSLKVENSLESIEEALKLNVDGIEVDVRSTKDGVPVAFHDANLSRILKVDKLLVETNLAELKALSKERGFTLPTLHDVLRLVGNKSMAVLDVKEWRVVDTLVKILHSLDDIGSIVVSSFDHRIPLYVKNEVSWVKAGLIVSLRPLSISRLVNDEVDCLFLRRDYADSELISEALDLGLQVYVWVINDKAEAERFWSLGVHGIVTDKPQLFVNGG